MSDGQNDLPRMLRGYGTGQPAPAGQPAQVSYAQAIAQQLGQHVSRSDSPHASHTSGTHMSAPTQLMSSFEIAVRDELYRVGSMLVEKNASYGNSALSPIRVFSHADAREQLRVRVDDKLSRVACGQSGAYGEDTVRDLIGYLVLLLVAERGGI